MTIHDHLALALFAAAFLVFSLSIMLAVALCVMAARADRGEAQLRADLPPRRVPAPALVEDDAEGVVIDFRSGFRLR